MSALTTLRCRMCALLLGLPGLGGCFLVGLSDEIDQASCESDADCGALTALDADPCMAWQCRTASDRGGSRYCQYTPLDADEDGFSPATAMGDDGEEVVCVEDPEQQDCADDAPERFPGNDEQCDVLDNDCDGLTDEGELRISSSSVVDFSGEVLFADFAADPETRTIAAVYGLPSAPGASLAAADTNQAQPTNPFALDIGEATSKSAIADEIGVAALDDDNFAVALFNRSGGGRMIAAVLPRAQDAKGWTVEVDPELEMWGLACSPTEDCAQNAARAGDPVAQPRSARPALGVDGRSLLVAYQRNPAGLEPGCANAPATDAQPTVLVNLVTRMAASPRLLVEPKLVALDLGRSSELTRPAVVTVPALDDTVTGFLVAFANGDGDIVVHHVWRGDDGPQTADTPLLTIAGGDLWRPAMAVGESADGQPELALAYQRGCGDEGSIELQFVTLTVDDAGALAGARRGAPVVVDDARGERPSVAFSEEARLWAVTYRAATSLRGRLLEAGGRLRGQQPYTLIASGDGVSVLQDPRVFRLKDDSIGFASVAQVQSGTDYRVEMTRILACE